MISPAGFFFFLEGKALVQFFLGVQPNIIFNEPQKKVSHTGLEWHEGQ